MCFLQQKQKIRENVQFAWEKWIWKFHAKLVGLDVKHSRNHGTFLSQEKKIVKTTYLYKWCVDFTKFLRKNRKKKLPSLTVKPTHLVLNQINCRLVPRNMFEVSFHVFPHCEYILVPILPDMNSYINNFFPLLGFLFLIKFFCHSMQSSVCTNYKLVSECKNSPNFIFIWIH